MLLKAETQAEIIVRKSRFIAYLRRCDSENEYEAFLMRLKKEHYTAKHHCSAYIGENSRRSNDDGEPAGCAGIPILSVLLKKDLTRIAAVVVRYFGGIKLGRSGLIQAYTQAVVKALAQGEYYEEIKLKAYALTIPYALLTKLKRELEKRALIKKIDYALSVTIHYLSATDLNDIIINYTQEFKPVYEGEEISERSITCCRE